MRLAALHLTGFRGARSVDLDFDTPLILLEGENGRGKSSLLQAIEWCLFGSIVEKKSSGISARVDWELAFRGTSHTEVRLLFERVRDSETTKIRLRRRRDADGERFECQEETTSTTRSEISDDPDGPRQAELFVVPSPASPNRVSSSKIHDYADGQAETRLEELGFPSWSEWRHAFCQHQENPRSSVVDSASRSAILASLLGLDAWTRLRQRIDAVRARKTLQQLDALEERTSNEVEQLLAKHDDRAVDIRRGLVDQGVRLDADTNTLVDRVARRLVDRAMQLAEPYGAIEGCDPEDRAFPQWLREFPRKLRAAASDASRLTASMQRKTEWITAIRNAREHWNQLGSATSARKKFVEQHGSPDDLESRRDAELATAAETEAVLRRLDAREALLREAQGFLRTRDVTDGDCPLCASHAPDLALRIENELVREATSEQERLRGNLKSARATADAANRALRDARRLLDQEEEARRRWSAARVTLAAKLEHHDDSTDDLVALAEDALRKTEREIEEANRHLEGLADGIVAFERDVALWAELGRLARAEAQDSARPKLEDMPERRAMDVALDRAAAFASDLEMLSRFAREEQAHASDKRLREVEESFGFYLGAILESARKERGDHATQYRFVQKGTAQNLRYDVVDEQNKSALAIANQATLSAIALALLFARAEARARDGQPAFVVLDDPAQSLDDAHARGLARALDRVLNWCPVLVATPHGALSDTLAELSVATRVVLAPYSAEDGVQIEARA